MRKLLMIHLLVIGAVITVATYLLLAAPWGFPPDNESFSNPRLDFAPVLFILGIVMMFSGVLVYELLPESKPEPE